MVAVVLMRPQTDGEPLALDAANSIQSSNSLEKMLAHQMATAHKLAMQLMGQVCFEQDATVQAKRLNAAARCMAVYQQGLLALQKVRQNGQQRITVQYVNVSNGSQAVIGHVERPTENQKWIRNTERLPTSVVYVAMLRLSVKRSIRCGSIPR